MAKATRRATLIPDRSSPSPAPKKPYEQMKEVATPGNKLQFSATHMDRWHHDLNVVSGSMVLAFGKTGLTPGAARAMIFQLRAVANDMEQQLFGG